MEYITNSTDMVAELSKSKRLKQIHKSVRKIKLSEKMGVKYMQKWEELAYAREEGKAKGKAEGEAKGEKIHLIKLVCKKLARGKAAETIAAELEEDEGTVADICRVAEDLAPDYDFNRIYEKLWGSSFATADVETGI